MFINSGHLNLVRVVILFFFIFSGCEPNVASKNEINSSVSIEDYTDSIYQILKAHRISYNNLIIERLTSKEKVIKSSEHWQIDKALLLPAQMFQETSKILHHAGTDLNFSLMSLIPINNKNSPRTEVEKKGLEFVQKNPELKFYEKEKIGSNTYFTAIYPDNAVSQACVSCHNLHMKSAKNDFKLGDNMGGVVIKILLDS